MAPKRSMLPDAPATPRQPEGNPKAAPNILRAVLRCAVLLAAAVACGGASVTLLGARSYHWRAFDVELRMSPATIGETRIEFTPLGELHARTHRAPVALRVALRSISLDGLKEFIERPPARKALEEDFVRTAHRDVRNFALWQIAIAALGGLAAPLALRVSRARWWLLSALAAGAFAAAMLWRTASTYDPKAFDDPSYTGSLRQADWIIAMAKEAFVKAEALSVKLRRVADNLNTLYGRINQIPGLAADVDTIRVLHVSDIHNNPAAVGFVEELADKMQVDLVIDTGDLTDLGLPVETELSRALANLKVPYVFLAGNHDSQATVAAVRRFPRAVILDGAPIQAAGLVILGAPDPSSRRASGGSVDTPPAELQRAGEALAQTFLSMPRPPDIVCVHNPRMAEPLVGKARLILCGHVHRAYIEQREGTILCNAGTTGAAGVRYFEDHRGVPLTAEVLAFGRHPQPHLLFVDQVALNGDLGSYSITRQSFTAPLGMMPSPAPGPAEIPAASR
ncbi:MAG: metallophosphoesterase family protein [Chthonomonadales bacterium]